MNALIGEKNPLPISDVQEHWLCTAHDPEGLPDLNPNQWVISQQREYLKALKAMGVTGFRVDAVKHMTLKHIEKIFTNDITSGMHVFGEVITGGGKGNYEYENFLKPYLESTTHGAYDFPLFAQIRTAFSINGNLNQLHDPKAYGQALDNSRSVTFVVTHDIPNNKGMNNQILDEKDEAMAYAYILGKDGGTPMVYSDELPDDEDSFNGRWEDVWKRPQMKEMISFHNSMHGKPMTVMFSDHCTLLFKRGKEGIVAINKCNETKYVTVDTQKYELNWNVNYNDVLSDARQVITSQKHMFELPARTARMYMY